MSEKRPYEDDKGSNELPSNTAPRPQPLKKRFITSFNQQLHATALASSSAPKPNLNTSTNTPMEPDKPLAAKMEELDSLNVLECDSNLSKRELLRNMRAAKTQHLMQRDRVKEVNDTTDQNESILGYIRLQIYMLRDELKATHNAILDLSTVSLADQTIGNVEEIVDEVQQIGNMLTIQIKSWSTNIQHLNNNAVSDTRPLIDFVRNEIGELQKSYIAISHCILKVQKDSDLKEQQVDDVTNRVWSYTKRLEDTQEELEKCIQDIVSAEKRIDRSKSTIAQEMMTGQARQDESSAPTTPARETGGTPTLRDDSTAAAPVDTTQAQLDESRLLLGIRQREHQDVQRDIYRLIEDENQLLDQVDMMSDEKIAKSEFVYETKSALEFYDSRSYYYERKNSKLKDMETRYKAERRTLIDQHESEKLSQGETLAQIKHALEEDHKRIGDQLRFKNEEYDNRVAKKNRVKEENIDIIKDAAELKQTMKDLEEKIRNLRQDDETSTKVESQDYSNLKRQIDLAHGMLHILGQNQKQGKLSSVYDGDNATIKQLKVNMDKLLLLINDEHTPLGVLDKLVKQRERLTLIIDFFENTERDLDAQMDFYGRIYDDGNRIQQMTDMLSTKSNIKTELVSKLASYHTSYINLEKTLAQEVQKVHDKRVISNRQADSVGTLEERIAFLEARLVEKEAISKDSERQLENLQLQVDDNSQEMTELQTSMERSETQLTELSGIAMDKTRMLDQELALKEEVEEDYQALQRKWDSIAQGENPASQQLEDEVESLRNNFKCSTCKTRRREVILVSCFHTFCRDCIRKQIETRQRRCPSCNFSFGGSDVKDFDLYNRH